jgi:hypothetical protein
MTMVSLIVVQIAGQGGQQVERQRERETERSISPI